MSKKRIGNVELDNDTITVNLMNHPSCVNSFIRCVNLAIKRKHHLINIVFKCEKEGIFPNACLPISALVQEYQKLYDIEFNLHIDNNAYLKHCCFKKPLELSRENIEKMREPMDKIFCYTGESGQVAAIVQAYIDCLSRTASCEEGVLAGLIWCINEVMDNVLVHSKETKGYVMAQYHKSSKIFAICVFDCGIGIYSSLSKSEKHKPASEIDSLTMAVQEGVGDGKGQGNGLFGLYQIVNENGGELCITSGESSIKLKNSELKKHDKIAIVSDAHKGTVVDFKLNLSKKIDIKTALKSIGGFDGFDIRLDNMLDDNDFLRYDVYDNCSGTGTRIAGEELRNDVLNTIRRMNTPIILDFVGVKACSSSFIDEFIAKMVVEIGFLKFNELVKIENMNDTVKHLCERSIAMRTHEIWSEVINQNQ